MSAATLQRQPVYVYGGHMGLVYMAALLWRLLLLVMPAHACSHVPLTQRPASTDERA